MKSKPGAVRWPTLEGRLNQPHQTREEAAAQRRRMLEADSTTTNVQRIYEGDVSADGDFDMEALIAFPDPASRAKWGWKQDEHGRWYREVEAGKSVFEEPKRDQ